MKSLRLSVCIATINRATFIGETLSSIVSQATQEIEIVILDGSKTDDTEQVVLQFQQQFPRIHYFREAPMGVDQDFCKVVELAHGEYCWLMPDDDILKPGAISAVLDELRNNYPLIIVNGQVRNADLSKILEVKRIKISENRVFKPNERGKLLATIGEHITYIGCVVIKRDLWNVRKKGEYFGTAFIHVGIIFQRPLPGDTLLISQPLIVMRYGNAMWSSQVFEIWMVKWPKLIWSFPGISDSAKRQVCLREPWQRLNKLVIFRAMGVYSLKEYVVWIKPHLRSFSSRFIARFVAQFPGFMMNSLSVVYTLIFYRHAKGMLLDFRNSKFYYANIFRRLLQET